MAFTATGIHAFSQAFLILSPAWKMSGFHSKSKCHHLLYIHQQQICTYDMECHGVLCNSFCSQIFFASYSTSANRSANMAFSPLSLSPSFPPCITKEQRSHRDSPIININQFSGQCLSVKSFKRWSSWWTKVTWFLSSFFLQKNNKQKPRKTKQNKTKHHVSNLTK